MGILRRFLPFTSRHSQVRKDFIGWSTATQGVRQTAMQAGHSPPAWADSHETCACCLDSPFARLWDFLHGCVLPGGQTGYFFVPYPSISMTAACPWHCSRLPLLSSVCCLFCSLYLLPIQTTHVNSSERRKTKTKQFLRGGPSSACGWHIPSQWRRTFIYICMLCARRARLRRTRCAFYGNM